MSLRDLGPLRRARRALSGGSAAGVVVLLYHRIARLDIDPWDIAVTPEHFAEHLDVLRRDCQVVPLPRLVTQLRHGATPSGDVAITFDDGYADNLFQAKPALERFDAPATVFVTTGPLAKPAEFWWDDLERIIFEPATLPASLELPIVGGRRRWELEPSAAADSGPNGARMALYRSLWAALRNLAPDDRKSTIEVVRHWAGAGSTLRDSHRTVTPDELLTLADGGLVSIGAHTVTHPRLSAIPPHAQETEITESRATLQRALGQPVTTFAYPHGSRTDYTANTVALAWESGLDCACSAFGGVVRQGTDLFQIPRFVVKDWDGDEFARQLATWRAW